MKTPLLDPKIIAKLKQDFAAKEKNSVDEKSPVPLKKKVDPVRNVVVQTGKKTAALKKASPPTSAKPVVRPIPVKVDPSKDSFRRDEVSVELLQELIEANRSFEITGLEAEGAMAEMIGRLEAVMARLHKTNRVYTVGRSAVVAAAAIPTGVTQLTGAAAAIGIGLHNFATYNPDYEIAKHLLDKKLSVNKKEVTMENGKRKSRLSFLGDIVVAAAGCAADAMLKNAKENAMRTGRVDEFNEKARIFNENRKKAREGFNNLLGKKGK